jgi:hypothetical protein
LAAALLGLESDLSLDDFRCTHMEIESEEGPFIAGITECQDSAGARVTLE